MPVCCGYMQKSKYEHDLPAAQAVDADMHEQTPGPRTEERRRSEPRRLLSQADMMLHISEQNSKSLN